MTSGTLFSAAARGAVAAKLSQHTAGHSRFSMAGTLTGTSIVAAYEGRAGGRSDHGGMGSDRLSRNDLSRWYAIRTDNGKEKVALTVDKQARLSLRKESIARG